MRSVKSPIHNPNVVGHVALLLALFFVPAAALAQPAEPTSEVHTVLYMVPRVPLMIRIRVDVDGRTLNEAWQAYVDDYFRRLDRDGDGVLRGKEVAGIPSVRELAALKLVTRTNTADWNLAAPRNFAAFMNLACGNPLTVNVVPRSPPSPSENQRNDVGQALFERLDADHSGQLSADELQWTSALSRFDRDDDDTLSRAELDPLQSPFFRFNSGPDKPAKASQAMLYVRSGDVHQTTARPLIDRYDGADGSPRDQQLSRAELELSAETFGQVDNDGSGTLDLDELRAWLRAPTPDVELTCRFGAQNKAEPAAGWKLVSAQPRPQLSLKITDRMMIVNHVYLVLEQPQATARVQSEFSSVFFKQIDQDGNGYLDEKEVPPRTEFYGDFAWMDTDHNGKVFFDEFSAFLDRQRAALSARADLTIVEQNNQLFELFDANDDGRLTARELKLARSSFPKWDLNDDGRLVLSEIPRRWQWQFTRGVASNSGMRPATDPSMNARKGNDGGPQWFRQMDRNQDGEVARREFLGPLPSFDRLDADHNGILDAGEAALAR